MDHSFGFAKDVDHVRILQSCNGLLLYSGLAWPVFYYVYNPSTNLFKRIPQPNYYLRDNSCVFSSGVFRLAFDPIKLVHYKVVQAGGEYGKKFESCGCLLLVCKDDIGFTEFTIYEMMKGYSVWSVRYLVNIKQLMNLLPKGWSIQISVWSICLGEGEEDAFVVINLSKKVVKYNLISKTNIEIFDIGSNQMDDDDYAVVFILPFKVDPNLYEFILSLASKVTPLFDSILVQQTEDKGDASERPSDSPPIPSPPHPSEDQPQI
ncbi:hypothetical protein Tco_0657619 [Tanacetum coccineum]